MTTIISQRHFYKFYLAIILFDIFWGLMALATGALFDQGSTLFGKIIMVIISAGLGFMVLYTIFRYYKNAPHIVVNDNSISLNSKVYYWRDLEKVEMTGKWSFKFMAERKEGMLLKFKGEQERYIFDDMYENSAQIKSFIETVTSEKTALSDISIANDVIETHAITTIRTNEVKPASYSDPSANKVALAEEEQASESIKWFKGGPLYSFDGIVWIGLILIFLSTSIWDFSRQHNVSTIVMMSFLSFLIFFFTCYRWNYFGISHNTLIIKNYNLFWLMYEYNLTDIKEIIFEDTGGRASVTRMTIIMKNFSTKKYPAATLRSKKWMQLKAELESKGIKVRNECVYYEPFKFKFFND